MMATSECRFDEVGSAPMARGLKCRTAPQSRIRRRDIVRQDRALDGSVDDDLLEQDESRIKPEDYRRTSRHYVKICCDVNWKGGGLMTVIN